MTSVSERIGQEPHGLEPWEECPLLRRNLYNTYMKLIVQIQLIPDADTGRKLRAVVERFHEATNWIAAECFTRREANVFNVRKFAYHEVRQRFGLSSQMAQLAIKAVCDAYKRDKSVKPTFRRHAAMPFDQ